METRTRWCSNTLQCVWTPLCQINQKTNNEQIPRLQRVFSPAQINGRPFTSRITPTYHNSTDTSLQSIFIAPQIHGTSIRARAGKADILPLGYYTSEQFTKNNVHLHHNIFHFSGHICGVINGTRKIFTTLYAYVFQESSSAKKSSAVRLLYH
jgi:hypothetical protein